MRPVSSAGIWSLNFESGASGPCALCATRRKNASIFRRMKRHWWATPAISAVVREAIDEADIIYHCAAAHSTAPAEEIRRTNLTSVKTLFDAVREAKSTARIVLMSSINVLGSVNYENANEDLPRRRTNDLARRFEDRGRRAGGAGNLRRRQCDRAAAGVGVRAGRPQSAEAGPRDLRRENSGSSAAATTSFRWSMCPTCRKP